MRYTLAFLVLGFFGWLSIAVGFGLLPDLGGGSSKTRFVMATVDTLTHTVGPAGAAGVVAALPGGCSVPWHWR